MLQFVLCFFPYYFLLLLFSAGFPQVSLDLTIIHQSDFLQICPPQVLPGGSPFVLIQRDDFNSHIPTVKSRGGDGTFRLILFSFLRCHYTVPLIRSASTHATKHEKITMPLSVES